MRLLDYLERKYLKPAGRAGHIVITKPEAEIFGIPFPLQKDWLDQFGGLTITEDMRDRLVLALSSMPGADAQAGLDVFLLKTSAGTFKRPLR